MKIKLLVSFSLTFLVALAGSLVTTPSIPTWYSYLNKPSFNPPNWLFAPVWTILFFLMALSFYLIWSKKVKNKKLKEEAIICFLIQLVLNFLWSLSFFAFHSPAVAFGIIIALWGLILLTILKFKKISKIAAWFLIPYLLWVSFASLLNFSVVLLN